MNTTAYKNSFLLSVIPTECHKGQETGLWQKEKTYFHLSLTQFFEDV